MKEIEVVAGIIFFEDKILCVQRPEHKYQYISQKFEFPGGKIEIGETKEAALKRELLEELNITPTIKSFFYTVVHSYPDFQLTMHTFICDAKTIDLKLNEHIAFEWLTLTELEKLDWAAADIPVVKKMVSNG